MIQIFEKELVKVEQKTDVTSIDDVTSAIKPIYNICYRVRGFLVSYTFIEGLNGMLQNRFPEEKPEIVSGKEFMHLTFTSKTIGKTVNDETGGQILRTALQLCKDYDMLRNVVKINLDCLESRFNAYLDGLDDDERLSLTGAELVEEAINCTMNEEVK
jgi:hypothetical protein